MKGNIVCRLHREEHIQLAQLHQQAYDLSPRTAEVLPQRLHPVHQYRTRTALWAREEVFGTETSPDLGYNLTLPHRGLLRLRKGT